MVRYSCLELAYVELFNPSAHGFVHGTSDPAVHGQFLVYEDVAVDLWRREPSTLSNAQVVHNHNTTWINVLDLFITAIPHRQSPYIQRPKPFVRNYLDLQFLTKIHGRLHIVEKHYLDGDEEVAVLKTVWLRIFQRKWRSIYNRRQTAIKNRMKISSLLHRERTGKWPRGMQVF
jgi:hypothetical protein